jgi:RNA polymerase sigma factor (sigma-70 family)
MIDLVGRSFTENEEPPEQDSRRLACLRECLEKLPARARQVIDLRYNVRLGIEKIAQSLAWQAGSIHVLLARTRKTLAECVRGKLSASEVT